MLAGLLAVALPSASEATSELASTPFQKWVTDGTVYAVAAGTDAVYVGGNFTLMGRRTGSWVAVDTRGNRLPRPEVDGSVNDAEPDGIGGWYLAGSFAHVAGVPRAGLAHLRRDASVDPTFLPTVNGEVATLVRRNSTLYVAGEFSRASGKRRESVAALDSRTGAALRWEPRVARGGVDAIAATADGKTVFLGGTFERVGGVKRAALAAVDGRTGALVRRWNADVEGAVDRLALSPDGRTLYVGGYLETVGGLPRDALAAVDARTGRVTRWRPDADDAVYDIVATAKVVYLAGDFNSVGGKSRRGVAVVNVTRGDATAWDPNVEGSVHVVLPTRAGRVYLGGEFSAVGGSARTNLAAVDIRSGALAGWNPRADGEVDVLSANATQQRFFVGGKFTSVGGAPRTGLAALSADGSRLLDWAPQVVGTVRSLALSPDGKRIYVGGRFGLGSDRTQFGLAAADTQGGTLSSFGGTINSGVWALAPTADGTALYLGGAFTTIAGATRKRLARIDAGTGALSSWNSGANGLVRTLAVAPDILYVGGDFSSIGGQTRRSLAALGTDNGLATGWDAGADDSVYALALGAASLYVGGEFTEIGGKSRKYLGAVDIADASALGWDPSPDDYVRALRLSPDASMVLAAGAFTRVGRAARDAAQFVATTGALTPWRPEAPVDADAVAFSPDGKLVYVAGEGAFFVFR